MLCDNCLKNTASVHMTTISNGQMQTVHLCGSCAAKKKGAVAIPWFSFNDFLSAFYEGEEGEDLKCNVCGTTLAVFKQSGRLGCSNCYKIFEANILPVLKGIHMNTVHTGKCPGERVDALLDGIESDHGRRDALKVKLREAVAVENFEEAARLRDEIARLEKEGE